MISFLTTPILKPHAFKKLVVFFFFLNKNKYVLNSKNCSRVQFSILVTFTYYKFHCSLYFLKMKDNLIINCFLCALQNTFLTLDSQNHIKKNQHHFNTLLPPLVPKLPRIWALSKLLLEFLLKCLKVTTSYTPVHWHNTPCPQVSVSLLPLCFVGLHTWSSPRIRD